MRLDERRIIIQKKAENRVSVPSNPTTSVCMVIRDKPNVNMCFTCEGRFVDSSGFCGVGLLKHSLREADNAGKSPAYNR